MIMNQRSNLNKVSIIRRIGNKNIIKREINLNLLWCLTKKGLTAQITAFSIAFIASNLELINQSNNMQNIRYIKEPVN